MIKVRSKKEIEAMREGGQIMAKIMAEVGKAIAPGKNTLELDKLAEKLVFANGGTPAFKGYEGGMGSPYPATACISINSEVVHGIPKKNVILKNGDLVKIDLGMKYENMFTDMARMFLVGNASVEVKKIKEAAEQSFWEGIKNLREGSMLSDYSKAVQKYVEANGFSVVRNLVGHGVGQKLHEDPIIPNYYSRRCEDYRLESGITLALEPMINAGTFETVLGKDGWIFQTQDGKLSGHYENTVLITKDGVEVLTILK